MRIKKSLIFCICSIFLICLMGCKQKNKAMGTYLDSIKGALKKTEAMKSGEIKGNIITTPNKGNLSFLTKEIKQMVHVTFSREDNTTYYDYTLTETDEKTTKIKQSKDGVFWYEDKRWIKIEEEPVDYFENLMELIQINYKECEIETILKSEENECDKYTVTMAEETLASGLEKLTYIYWITNENQLSRVLVNQQGVMTEDEKTDELTTVWDISFY